MYHVLRIQTILFERLCNRNCQTAALSKVGYVC